MRFCLIVSAPPSNTSPFATSDIFETLEKLTGRGFKTLPISPNYYDDLAARALIWRMTCWTGCRRKASCMIRKTAPDFSQSYSLWFSGNLFIEFVQKRARLLGLRSPECSISHRRPKKDSSAQKGMPKS